MKIKAITCVVPCYNEEEVLPEFYRRMALVADGDTSRDYTILFVNDGSADATAKILEDLAQQDQRVEVLHFARNFGHQAALTAGIDEAEGDAVVTIDADLQDPPELIPALLERMEAGADIVHAQRSERDGESRFKLATAWLFYKIMKLCGAKVFVENCGDFRAFTQEVAEVFRRHREPHRYIRGMFASFGFTQDVLQYKRDARYAGTTHYPFLKMFSLALNALTSFSALPLHAIIWMAILCWGFSLVYLAHALFQRFVNHVTVAGWTSLIILLVFFSGIQLFSIGMVGLYVGKVFEQGQRRPLYTIRGGRKSKRQKLESEH